VVETHSGYVLRYGLKYGLSYLVKNGEVKRLTVGDLSNKELFEEELKAYMVVAI